MITEQWQLGLLLAAFVIHLMAIGFVYRHRDRGSRPVGTASDPERDLLDREEGVLECPRCATDNELGYRYCRSCVSELPESRAFGGARDTPLGRIVR